MVNNKFDGAVRDDFLDAWKDVEEGNVEWWIEGKKFYSLAEFIVAAGLEEDDHFKSLSEMPEKWVQKIYVESVKK